MDVAAAGDRPLNFHINGAMGAAASTGLGLALARPDRRVLVVTGDGELMMNIGALATIAAQRPRNLAIVVFDNERPRVLRDCSEVDGRMAPTLPVSRRQADFRTPSRYGRRTEVPAGHQTSAERAKAHFSRW